MIIWLKLTRHLRIVVFSTESIVVIKDGVEIGKTAIIGMLKEGKYFKGKNKKKGKKTKKKKKENKRRERG